MSKDTGSAKGSGWQRRRRKYTRTRKFTRTPKTQVRTKVGPKTLRKSQRATRSDTGRAKVLRRRRRKSSGTSRRTDETLSRYKVKRIRGKFGRSRVARAKSNRPRNRSSR